MASITALEGAKLADLVYGNLIKNSYDAATKATVLDFYTNPSTGLQMALLQVGDRKVVAFRGTTPTSKQDILTDLDMYAYLQQAGVAHQFNQAGVVLSQWIADPQYKLSTSNTTIVGHSLGGSLAQYFGATTGFETLTYNAYGIGNEISGGSNITNYITMHDFVSPLPGSQMVGRTYMLQDENLTDVFGHGITNFTSESSWIRGYSRVDDPHSIDVIDGIGSSGLDSAYELALRLSEGRVFAMINGSIDDVIFGGEIDNVLIGGSGADKLNSSFGDDTLIGGFTKDKVNTQSDRLQGGDGYDKYYSGNGDIINDSDGKGRVYFEGLRLTGGVLTGVSGSTRIYQGDGGTYRLNGNLLTFTKEGKILTIENYHKLPKDLGIDLRDKGEIIISISDASAMEAQEQMVFKVSLKSDFPRVEPITIYTSVGSVTIPVGQSSGTIIYKWANDNIVECKDEVFKVSVTGTNYTGEMTVIHTDTAIGNTYTANNKRFESKNARSAA